MPVASRNSVLIVQDRAVAHEQLNCFAAHRRKNDKHGGSIPEHVQVVGRLDNLQICTQRAHLWTLTVDDQANRLKKKQTGCVCATIQQHS